MLTYWEILTAIQSNVPVNDSYAQLWGRKSRGGYTVTTYTGTLPATLTGTKEGYLHRYKIYGNTEQIGTPTPENPIVPSECGARTENLVDISTVEKGRIDSGTVGYASATISLSVSADTISFTTDANYRGVCCGFVEIPTGAKHLTLSGMFTGEDGISRRFVFYDSQKTWLNADAVVSASLQSITTVAIPTGAKYVRLSFTGQRASNYTIRDLMLNSGSTALPYETYGYKLPLTSAGQDVDIYIGDDTISAEEYVDSGTGKVYRMVDGVLTPVDPPVPFPQIPTSANSTTISWAGEGLAPSQVELEYDKKR